MKKISSAVISDGYSVFIVCILLVLHLFLNLVPDFIPDGEVSESAIILINKIFHAASCLVPVLIYRMLSGKKGIKRTLRVNCMPSFPMFFISLVKPKTWPVTVPVESEEILEEPVNYDYLDFP